MARICLITPGHLSTNPRIVKEADALEEAGHDVGVIAADYLDWARKADEEFATRPWRVARKLAVGPDAAMSRRLYHGLRLRAARALMGVGVRTPKVVCTAWHPIAPELVRAAMLEGADLYVAHYPAALPAAALAAKANGARYAFDAEDFHLGDVPEGPAFEGARTMVRMIEAEYLPGCAYVTAASPGIADAYAVAYGIPRPAVVLNVFPRSNAPDHATAAGYWSHRPSLYWFSQTIGADRGLECAVRAIGMSRVSPHLVLRGNPSPAFVASLSELARRGGTEAQLHLLPPALPSEMERLSAVHDIGLVSETGHTPNRRIALTNKLFSFLLAGVPVLLSDIPAHRRIACELGIAARLYREGDPDQLAAAIDELLSPTGEMLASARRHAFSLGQQRFNWDLEKHVLLSAVDRALSALRESTEADSEPPDFGRERQPGERSH